MVLLIAFVKKMLHVIFDSLSYVIILSKLTYRLIDRCFSCRIISCYLINLLHLTYCLSSQMIIAGLFLTAHQILLIILLQNAAQFVVLNHIPLDLLNIIISLCIYYPIIKPWTRINCPSSLQYFAVFVILWYEQWNWPASGRILLLDSTNPFAWSVMNFSWSCSMRDAVSAYFLEAFPVSCVLAPKYHGKSDWWCICNSSQIISRKQSRPVKLIWTGSAWNISSRCRATTMEQLIKISPSSLTLVHLSGSSAYLTHHIGAPLCWCSYTPIHNFFQSLVMLAHSVSFSLQRLSIYRIHFLLPPPGDPWWSSSSNFCGE